MKEKIRFGVIELGMGRHHLKILAANPNVKVTALCDIDKEILNTLKKEFDIPQVFTDAEKMLQKAQLDAVIIATPNYLHASQTIAALNAKLHVLCEKPMAMSASEAREMQATARKVDKKLMINMSYRFLPASMALKKQIEAGVLGDIYFTRTVWHRRQLIPFWGEWFHTKSLSGGGPLIDLGVHRIDLALWLMDFPGIKTISAATYDHLGKQIATEKGKNYDVEDFAVALLRLENGAALSIEMSWATQRYEKEFMETRLYGALGGGIHQNIGESYEFESKVFTIEGGFHTAKTFRDGPTEVPTSIDHFVDCIVNDRSPLITGDDGVRLMEVLDGIYRSAELGREISIEN